MQKKYAKDGLAAVSVNTDPKAKHDRALKMLQHWDARFTNLLLDVPAREWSEKLDANTPCVWVFDRDGRLVQKFQGEDAKYDKIEPLIKDLLKK